ncbi:hypothetical protein D3C73_1243450 [compost metagenome]
MQVLWLVQAVAAVAAGGRFEQAYGFVIADHLGAEPAAAGGLADIHGASCEVLVGFQVLSHKALLTTLTLDSAMAAPASTGFR